MYTTSTNSMLAIFFLCTLDFVFLFCLISFLLHVALQLCFSSSLSFALALLFSSLGRLVFAAFFFIQSYMFPYISFYLYPMGLCVCVSRCSISLSFLYYIFCWFFPHRLHLFYFTETIFNCDIISLCFSLSLCFRCVFCVVVVSFCYFSICKRFKLVLIATPCSNSFLSSSVLSSNVYVFLKLFANALSKMSIENKISPYTLCVHAHSHTVR